MARRYSPHNLDHAKWNIEQNGLEVCVAKVSDNEINKGRDTTARHRNGKHHCRPKPGFDVEGRLLDVSPFPLGPFDALVVCPQSVQN